MLKRTVLWLRANLQRRRLERDMRDEMHEHLDRATRRLTARGLPADEARREALREFGNLAYHQTVARHARGTLWLDELTADSRFAMRHFARRPGTTMLMIIVLAFGMSISTLLFSWVHGLSILPPPAVTLEDDMVRIRGSRRKSEWRRFQEDEFLAYRNLSSHFTSIAGWVDRKGVIQVPDEAERRGYPADLTFVTENYFQVLGIQPILGAGLPTVALDDPVLNAVAVIDHQTWTNLIAQRQDVIGSTLTINGVAITIVGVAPARFKGVRGNQDIQVWLPLSALRLVMASPSVEFNAVARLRPGESRERATAAVQAIAARVDTISQETRQPGAEVVPLLAGNFTPEFEGNVRQMMLVLGALGVIVLLVTCTNVSALLTGLASARRQEIAVRLSLGAGRARIVRQLLTESAVLGLVAGTAALTTVALLLKLSAALIPGLPLQRSIAWPTMGFTFATALAVGMLFGLAPALHATRLALAGVLRDSTRGIASSRSRLQRGLIVAQVALTQPLIALMVTMLISVSSMTKPVAGSNSGDRVITLRVQTPSTVLRTTPKAADSKHRELMLRFRDQVRAMPGVSSAVIDWPHLYLPGAYTSYASDMATGRSQVSAKLAVQRIEGAHFDVLGIPLTHGRTFVAGDIAEAATALEAPIIIGADLASHLWGDIVPIGRRLELMPDSKAGPWSVSRVAGQLRRLVVVGVVNDPVARARSSTEPYRVYLPMDTAASSELLLVSTTAAAAALLPQIRSRGQLIAPNAVITAQTLADVQEQRNVVRRRVSAAISVGGIVALLLSAIGLYAVIAFAVGQRTQEIAVRLAVGANHNQITYKFVGEGMRLAAFGLVLGLPAGMLALRQLLPAFDLAGLPVSPIILIASTGIFLVAAASSWGPARRAATLDPATAFRLG